MATHSISVGKARSSAGRLIGGRGFDAVFLLVAGCFVTGTYLDSWAHNNIPALETFFTPWHGVLYAGVFLTAIVLAVVIVINRVRGATWQEAVPAGYGLSVLGAYGMLVVGVGDGFWHTIFGVEKNVDAIFSPTHLAGMICSNLMVAGLYRSLYLRLPQRRIALADQIWLILAITLFFAMIANDTQPTSPFITLYPVVAPTGEDLAQLLAVTSFVIQATIFTGLALYSIRRWQVPFGFFTVPLTVVGIVLSLMKQHYIVILASLLAGLIIDICYVLLRPSLERPWQLRTFAIFASATLYLVYMIVLEIAYGLVWSIHMTVGSIFVTCVLGWLLSYLALPGKGPELVQDTEA